MGEARTDAAKTKVLVIDDEEDLGILAKHVLTLGRSDLEVLEARDGPSGLELARTERPSVILLDVMMPIMDGYEVCRRLKGDPATRDIPVVMLTASKDPHLNRKAFDAGALACLAKPYRREALVSCVEVALASAGRARDQLA